MIEMSCKSGIWAIYTVGMVYNRSVSKYSQWYTLQMLNTGMAYVLALAVVDKLKLKKIFVTHIKILV